MFWNYCKIAFRNLWKNKFTAVINIGGLAISLASFFIILLYLNYELSYDQWDPSLKAVYRVSQQSDNGFANNQAPIPLASLLQQHLPEIIAYTHIQPSGEHDMLVSQGDKKIYQKDLVMADSSFLQVFPYHLVAGNAATALQEPSSALISATVSHKLFGNSDPIGKVIMLFNQIPFTVTGVIQAAETPSHLHAEVVLRDPFLARNSGWGNLSYVTYIRLRDALPVAQLEDKVNRTYYEDHVRKGKETYASFLQTGHTPSLMIDAVKDIHNFPRFGSSPFHTTLILFLLAALLLLSGALNSSNLSLVKTLKRSREVGVRKVLGSSRKQILSQFLLEVTLQCSISLVLALLLCVLVLPLFNNTFGLSLSFFRQMQSYAVLWQSAGALLLIILISGLYPALIFSGQGAAKVLKGHLTMGITGRRFSHSLIVVQFAVSVFFIISVLVMEQQMQYMRHKDIGFNGAQVVQIEATQNTREDNFEQTRAKLLRIPGVQYVSKSTAIPGSNEVDTVTYNFRYAGNDKPMVSVRVSTDYFVTLGIKVLTGRLFATNHPEDFDNTAIINETAAKSLGVQDPVGSQIRFAGCDSVPYQIVGVVKDFQVQGFESRVRPTLYSTSNGHCSFQSGGALLVKVNTADLDKTIGSINQLWETVEPGFPLRYSFLDQNFQQLFSSYTRVQYIIRVFTIISILISVMGLLALTVYITEQRTKEIGIRKVLGASVGGIVALLSKDFLKLVIMGIIVASPVAYYLLQQWLKDFAYRVSISWYMFALAAAGALLITIVTVGFQAVKAAIADPVKSLKVD
ncbi:putative ABC transport system permease protein [Chitinophaga niastensis]|uniref:Putative ABC transport system permease protein n=1 Tax=Chitinophaga niastensis TaxID=536980 RepID=A0A2P8HNT8_CHINA|nr:ABC transporter permease [Chitinophaga niastensis]PSL47837.1 putative ABC transport system permease protein [Chitinophaga niastensis]